MTDKNFLYVMIYICELMHGNVSPTYNESTDALWKLK